MVVVVKDELTLLLLHHQLVLILRILRVEVRHLIMRGDYPRVVPQVSRRAHFLQVLTLHLVLGKALLHAPANESLAVLGESVENLHEGQGLLIWFICAASEILNGVDEAARSLHVRYLLQVLFVDHLEVTSGSQDQQDSKVKQVLLLEFLHASLRREIVGIALMHETRRRSAIDWIGTQVAELLLYQALSIFVVLQRVR